MFSKKKKEKKERKKGKEREKKHIFASLFTKPVQSGINFNNYFVANWMSIGITETLLYLLDLE